MQEIRWLLPSDRARGSRSAGDSRLERRVLEEKISSIVLQTPQGLAGPAALAAIVAILAWNHVARGPMLVTLCLLSGALLAWARFYVSFRRTSPETRDVEAWARGTLLRTLAHGACWASYSLVLFQADSIVYQSVDVAFMYGLVAGAVVVDGPHFGVFLAFAVPTLTPVVLCCLAQGTPASLAVGSAGLVGLVHGVFAAKSAAKLTDREIRARLQNLELVRELERQSALAEAARQEAEAANREKSRFLAAASHDLRQPVHALGLFVAAARSSSDELERREILEKIAVSVAALRQLFDALLEISRLDAGVIEPRVTSVGVRPLLERLAVQHEPAARAKQLRLLVHARELHAETDPALLERVLGNLLENAVRYTERGGVVLACRRRAGRVRVEVWDTGVGIAPEHARLIFEPFYQIAAATQGPRAGVGLGLAICARIAGVLGHTLELRSTPRGSRFALELGAAAPAPTSEKTLDETQETEAALLGAVVVIIDDEPEPARASELLLKQWGCRVVLATNAENADAELQRRDLEPDLVLADFRLQGGRDGSSAVRHLRRRYDERLPAAIITADTSTQRLLEIESSGMVVLHKPVRPIELQRAAVQLIRSAEPKG